MYDYRAHVTRVIDGDTIICDVDLGFNVSVKQTFRFYDIDTPEIRTRNLDEKRHGYDAKQFVESKITDKDIIIKTEKDDRGSFGRYLAKIFYYDDLGTKQDLIEQLKEFGFEKKENY